MLGVRTSNGLPDALYIGLPYIKKGMDGPSEKRHAGVFLSFQVPVFDGEIIGSGTGGINFKWMARKEFGTSP
jgi:hypothetical protein